MDAIMMKIKTFYAIDFPENCYAGITPDGIFLVDPGEKTEELLSFVRQNATQIKWILLTHRHIDHIGAAAEIKRLCPAARLVIHRLDAEGLTDPVASLSRYFGMPQTPVSPDLLCEEGDVLRLGQTEILVWHTPGHSAGSVCYQIGDVLFCGDLIFRQSCGRIDFPTGDPHAMRKSLERLRNFDGELTLYPGHMEPTTLSAERAENPYLQEFFA